MTVMDGSHVVETPDDMKMVSIKVHYEGFAEVLVFAEDVATVKKFVKTHRWDKKIPLPFGGHDGSQNLKLKSIKVAGVKS